MKKPLLLFLAFFTVISLQAISIEPVSGTINSSAKTGTTVIYNLSALRFTSTDATANGLYTPIATNGGIIQYTNAGSVDNIFWQTNGNAIIPALNASSPAIVSNTTIPNSGSFNGVMYDGNPYIPTIWNLDNGSDGNAVGMFSNAITTSAQAFSFNNKLFQPPTNNVITVDLAGDDDLGFPGGYPFRSLTAALSVAKSNMVIQINAGTFNEQTNVAPAHGAPTPVQTNGAFVVPAGVHIRGSGPQATTVLLGTSHSPSQLQLNGFSSVEDLNLQGVIQCNYQSNYLSDLEVQSSIDAIFINFPVVPTNLPHFFKAKNCTFTSGFDVFVVSGVSGASGGSTNLGTALCENCVFRSDKQFDGGNAARGPAMQAGGTIVLKNCVITQTNFNTSSPCLTVTATNSYIDAYNCTFYCAVTNGRIPYVCSYAPGGLGTIYTHGFSVPQFLVQNGTNTVDNQHGGELFDTLGITTNFSLPAIATGNATNTGLTNYGTFYWSNFTKMYFIGSSNGVYRTNVIF